uniref:TACC_C domain-containing protein n=1 Tax=Caenorhabditis tropicalis TaxID=1561998 RepID=A0A1I7U7N1_9PELO
MEALDKYMNRISSYLTSVNDKDELINEGIKKMAKCERNIEKYRLESRKLLAESREEVLQKQEECNRKAFENEQCKEKLHQMNENASYAEQELKQLIGQINNKMGKAMEAWNEEKTKLQEQRQIFGEIIENNLSKLSRASNNESIDSE